GGEGALDEAGGGVDRQVRRQARGAEGQLVAEQAVRLDLQTDPVTIGAGLVARRRDGDVGTGPLDVVDRPGHPRGGVARQVDVHAAGEGRVVEGVDAVAAVEGAGDRAAVVDGERIDLPAAGQVVEARVNQRVVELAAVRPGDLPGV